MSRDNILLEYDHKIKTLENISQSVLSLINTLLTSANIDAHTVSCRVKDRNSLVKKIEKKDKYIKLEEITDIVGIRIITHYSDDVDIIATLLENEFLIDEDNSIDKRQALDPDRFGYLSLHYVVEFNKERLKLMEYKAFKGLKFEIQIRSILQHTWAEIEHDIGYKSKSEIPKEVRRQFSRLAGLLEIADQEFVNIRTSLVDYQKHVEKTISESPENIYIDAISLYMFISTGKVIQEIDSLIVEKINCKLYKIDQDRATKLVKNIEYFGISTISELADLLSMHKIEIMKAIEVMISKDGSPSNSEVHTGVAIRFLSYVLASKSLSENEYDNFIKAIRVSPGFSVYLKELKNIL